MILIKLLSKHFGPIRIPIKFIARHLFRNSVLCIISNKNKICLETVIKDEIIKIRSTDFVHILHDYTHKKKKKNLFKVASKKYYVSGIIEK